jgi:uncharacterized membrane protein
VPPRLSRLAGPVPTARHMSHPTTCRNSGFMTEARESRLLMIRGVLRRSQLVPLLMWLLILAYAALYAWLSILRHETFGSGAMDMGYTDQVVWNTLHGRFMRFSTYAGAQIDLPLSQFRRTDTLLAYHVELLLAPISLLYLLYDSPLTLLVLQSVAVALGAWPAFQLARKQLQNDLAGLVFGLAYLMAPAIQGAILSDFHAATLAAPLLLYALELAQRQRFRGFYALAVLAMLAKEDIPLLVAMLGLYLFVVLRERRWGAVTMLTGLAWFLVCTLLILPHYNGLSGPPFLYRLAIFGPTLRQSILNWIAQPSLLLRWLSNPEIASYLEGLLASTGFLSLFSPLVLGLASPVLAVNVFSTWSWTYSEGDHYSVSIVPFVIVSAIYGTRFLVDRVSRRWSISPQRLTAVLALWVLLVGGIHHYQVGISPLARQYAPPRITAHDRLGDTLIAMIPADAPISAQSNLYPHLAHREKAYFFPAVNDAEYVFLDVTSTPYPLSTKGLQVEARSLLRSAEFGVLAAQDGYLVLQRGIARTELPQVFYDFARSNEVDIPHPLHVRFGDVLELVGYDYRILNVVQAHELPTTIDTFWRALRPVDFDYQFPLFFTRADGAIVFLYDEGSATTVWYPPYHWEVGEVVRVETPILDVGRLHDVLLAVTRPGADPWQLEGRLPALANDSASAQLLDQGTLVRIFRFQ